MASRSPGSAPSAQQGKCTAGLLVLLVGLAVHSVLGMRCNSLQSLYPDTAAEWDYSRNQGQLSGYTASSHYLAWWSSPQLSKRRSAESKAAVCQTREWSVAAGCCHSIIDSLIFRSLTPSILMHRCDCPQLFALCD